MGETLHLLQVARRIEHDVVLRDRADVVLRGLEKEPLMDGLYETPMSNRFHAEGPTVRSHLRLMLMSLFAILDGKIHLLEIEEFARLKGMEDEIQEMEQMLTENPATFEVFCLIHDVGKQFKVFVDDQDHIHYHGHAKEIYRPEIRDLLYRLAAQYKLEDRDVEMIVPLVAFHLEPLHRFRTSAHKKDVELIAKLGAKQGQDSDDFMNMLQAAILLDQVFGSREVVGEKITTDANHLVNFLIAEREYAPWKLAQKEAARALERKRSLHKVLVEAKLDGHGMMQLTGMKPGRELGDLLKKIQAAVLEEGELPKEASAWKDELARRLLLARARL